MPNRESWDPTSINKTGGKSPTILREPSAMRRSLGSHSSAGNLSTEYNAFVNRRES